MATIHRSKTGAGPWLSTEDTGGGAATAGAARVLGPFPFAFDDVGLNDGIEFYTPAVNDVMVTAWIEVTEAFDGTTPLADFGMFDGITAGFFANQGLGAVDVSTIDAGLFGGGTVSQGIAPPPSDLYSSLLSSSPTGLRVIPLRFTIAQALKIVVSQDGEAGGTAVGGTAGAGAVYLVVATPSLT
jgi:hypothetical protein